MDTTVGNSFFYFFSAVPQVLAATMALFGVFVIFKVQNLKDEMLGTANNLNIFMKNFSDARDTASITSERFDKCTLIENCIKSKDVYLLRLTILHNLDSVTMQRDEFKLCQRHFAKLIVLFQLLKKSTIVLTALSGFIIILCLSTIPLSNFMNLHPLLLKWLFIFIIILLFFVLSGLIVILSFALNDGTEWTE
ncbi:MAG TPA: hypothetical protein PLG47_03915 [Candidatus Dojkabacteria bacterium]|nr:hypothetical protein [Candidatus Dojkabacteria bacterium]